MLQIPNPSTKSQGNPKSQFPNSKRLGRYVKPGMFLGLGFGICSLLWYEKALGRGFWGVGLTQELIGQLGYVGIALLLVLGGLGLPVPEEAPIVLAAV